MDAVSIGLIGFACTFGGAMAGLWLGRLIPDRHRSAETWETVKLAIGLVATMTAVVLGLVTAAAKTSFDALSFAIKDSAAEVITLDRVLARYGPETREIRQALRDAVGRRLDLTWPQDGRQAARLESPETLHTLDDIVERVHALPTRDDNQRRHSARALQLCESLLKSRWVAATGAGHAVPVAFLVVVVFWLTVSFTTYALFAPSNGTVILALLVCTISIASALFLIMELDSPFEGFVTVSPEPLRFAYAHMGP
jgi:hypothetical protein